MRPILTFAVFVAVLVQLIDATTLTEYREACLKEMGIDPADFSLTDTKKEHRCVYKCVGQKAGFFDADGKPTDTHAMFGKPLTPEMEEQMKECFAIEDADVCEKIYKQRLCFKEKMKA